MGAARLRGDDLAGFCQPGHADHAQTMPGTCVHLAIHGDVHISDATRALSRQSRNDPKLLSPILSLDATPGELFDNLLQARSQIHGRDELPLAREAVAEFRHRD